MREEQVVDKRLCWRNAPDAEWTQYSAEALTVALLAERTRTQDAKLRVELEEVIQLIDKTASEWFADAQHTKARAADILISKIRSIRGRN